MQAAYRKYFTDAPTTLRQGGYGGRNSGCTLCLSVVGRISLAAKRTLRPCWTL